jgi:hypothetical protein
MVEQKLFEDEAAESLEKSLTIGQIMGNRSSPIAHALDRLWEINTAKT